MLDLKDINNDTWKEILYANSPDDIETMQFIQENEEKILK